MRRLLTTMVTTILAIGLVAGLAPLGCGGNDGPRIEVGQNVRNLCNYTLSGIREDCSVQRDGIPGGQNGVCYAGIRRTIAERCIRCGETVRTLPDRIQDFHIAALRMRTPETSSQTRHLRRCKGPV